MGEKICGEMKVKEREHELSLDKLQKANRILKQQYETALEEHEEAAEEGEFIKDNLDRQLEIIEIMKNSNLKLNLKIEELEKIVNSKVSRKISNEVPSYSRKASRKVTTTELLSYN